MKQQPILSRTEWITQCCEHLQELDPALATAHCHELATSLWDRAQCQVMAPDEAAAFMFDERMHAGARYGRG